MQLSRNILVVAALALPQLAFAGTVWLPDRGALDGSLNYVHQSADRFFIGSQEMSLPDDLELDTYLLDVTYGIADGFAAFGQFGYAESTFDPVGDNDSGVIDSRVGLAWTVLDEFAAGARIPTVTLRGAAIVAGDYETGRIDAVGDGGDGFELAAAVGRALTSRVSVYSDAGYRWRSDRVPDDAFAGVGASFSLPLRTEFSLGYEYNDSQGDLDIGGPGFSPDRFPEVEDDRELATGALSWAIGQRFGVALNYGRVLDGRNTSKSDVLGISFGGSF